MNICIIPARSASRRIPNKNIRPFLGFPIIEYPFNSAIESGLFKHIIITTDSDIIENLFKNEKGCTIIKRPEHLCGDNIPVVMPILHAIEKMDFKILNNICVMFPTSVFIKPGDLIKASMKLKNNDAVISVTEIPHPIERALCMNNRLLKMIDPQYEYFRTQDLPKKYFDAGQFYLMDSESFMSQRKMFMDKCIPYVMDSVDIDSESDWKRAEAYYASKFK
jgi:CMP-N-acetylneuraminic acid synthetase